MTSLTHLGRLAALLLAGAAPAALAQEGAPSAAAGAVVYEPDFFAPFSPRTALDMVSRVPGFRLAEGAERRGFSGAQANVLIDGEAPASKDEIDDVLARIPAADVVRIELLRGAGSSASSAQGVRVNIVRRAGGGEGVWEVSLARSADARVTPSGEAAWSGRTGEIEYALAAAYEGERSPIRGARRDDDALGALDELREENIPIDERTARVSGELGLPAFGGAATLSLQLGRIEADEFERGVITDALGAPGGLVTSDLEERESFMEFASAYRRSMGDWRTELGVVVARRRFEGDEIASDFDGAGVLDETVRQTQRVDTGETILRASGRRELSQNWALALGGEVALNTLEQRLSLTEDTGTGPTPIVLPSANVRVEEERAELSAMLSGSFSPSWTLEAGASVEVSRLTQSGDADRETDLNYWKPSIQIIRALGERNQLRLRFYRDVGQLDFDDFASASDITSSLVDAGNPNLRPETSWRLEAAGDWRFGEEGAFGVTLYRWAVEDTLDIIPLGPPGDQFDAPGNIGDASVLGARITLALPLPASAELRVDAMAQRSEATDPLTGESRSISEFEESTLTLGLRQDVASLNFAWGVDYERELEAPAYRLDRIEQERDAEDLTLWIETTALPGLKLRAWGANLTDSAETRDRNMFDPDRLGVFDGSDTRARRAGRVFGLALSGRF